MRAGTAERRQSPRGDTRSDLLVSAHIGRNTEVFAQILALHVPAGSIVADVTYGKGIFWQKVNKGLYTLLATDIQTGVDCRNLPYDDGSIDCVVLDPPYMEGFYRRKKEHMAMHGQYESFRDMYSDGKPQESMYQQAVLDMYVQAGEEAARVLRDKGVFIVKCQDAVSSRRQHLTHVDLVNAFVERGFYAKDLFVVVRNGRPSVSRILQQMHARKNHSYFLVFVKEQP